MKISLKNKLMFFFGVLVIVPIVAGNIILMDMNTQAVQEHMRRFNQNNARLSGMKINEVMDAIFHLSKYIAMENSIVEYLTTPQDDPLHPAIEARAQRSLSALMTANSYLTSINITSMDGRTISRGGSRGVTITEEDMYRADALNGFFFWDTVYTDQGPAIYLCRLIRDINDVSHHHGYIKMLVGLQGLSDLLVSPLGYPGVHYMILDAEGSVVLSGGNKALLNGDFYASSYMLRNDWQLLSIVSGTNLLIPGFAQITILIMALVFLICMLLANLFSALTVKPIKHLGRLMQQVGKGDFSAQFNMPAEKELHLLAMEFNQMSEKLNKLYNEVYVYQLQSYKAKLMEMESKINPHFLYNSLDSIYWMAKLKRHEEVSGMASALSNLFRLALSADSSGFVKLSEELEYLSCYKQIQQYRYGDNITFTSSVDKSLCDRLVCRFVLQPIVENAIIHGLSEKGCGIVDIQVYCEDGDIVYRVSDSGGCVDLEEVHKLLYADEDEIEGTKGLALRNIQNRIHLCYGEPYGVDYFIEDGKTVFKVRQPLNVSPKNGRTD